MIDFYNGLTKGYQFRVSLSQKEIMILFINYLPIQEALDHGSGDPDNSDGGTQVETPEDDTPVRAAILDSAYCRYFPGMDISTIDNQ